MVTGLDRFSEYFHGFEGSYVLIGGAASYLIEESNLLVPRATKDLDLILVVEALTDEFVRRFWEFVREAGYIHKQRGAEKSEFYRFYQPKDSSFPFQIELLSRKPDIIFQPDDIVIGPIPTGEELSSLSAIMMDDDYYYFTIEHSDIIQNVHIAKSEALICLKAKAYLNLRANKEAGRQVNSGDIVKHKNDVIRLGATLSPDSVFTIPRSIHNDLDAFLNEVVEDLPHDDFLKRIGLNGNLTVQGILDIIKRSFLAVVAAFMSTSVFAQEMWTDHSATDKSMAYYGGGIDWVSVKQGHAFSLAPEYGRILHKYVSAGIRTDDVVCNAGCEYRP